MNREIHGKKLFYTSIRKCHVISDVHLPVLSAALLTIYLPCIPLILPSIHSSRRLPIYAFISRFRISFSFYPSVHQATHSPHRPAVSLFVLRSFLSFIHHSYRQLISTLIWRFIHPPVHSHIHTRQPTFPYLHHSHRTPSSTIRPSGYPCITIKHSILSHRQTCFFYVSRVIVLSS
jgi:hypothetical protein